MNIDVTSSGATLALAFMFMKTHNRSVADRIQIPDTQFLLDFIRPDFLLLRIVSHSLIMWDGIEPTKEWVESKSPPVTTLSPFCPPPPSPSPLLPTRICR